MSKLFFYQEEQKLVFGLHGSKSRCSISSKRSVRVNAVKKRGRKGFKSIFKKVCKVICKIIEFIVAIGTITEFTMLILNELGW